MLQDGATLFTDRPFHRLAIPAMWWLMAVTWHCKGAIEAPPRKALLACLITNGRNIRRWVPGVVVAVVVGSVTVGTVPVGVGTIAVGVVGVLVTVGVGGVAVGTVPVGVGTIAVGVVGVLVTVGGTAVSVGGTAVLVAVGIVVAGLVAVGCVVAGIVAVAAGTVAVAGCDGTGVGLGKVIPADPKTSIALIVGRLPLRPTRSRLRTPSVTFAT